MYLNKYEFNSSILCQHVQKASLHLNLVIVHDLNYYSTNSNARKIKGANYGNPSFVLV
jgi:hypothetical protein